MKNIKETEAYQKLQQKIEEYKDQLPNYKDYNQNTRPEPTALALLSNEDNVIYSHTTLRMEHNPFKVCYLAEEQPEALDIKLTEYITEATNHEKFVDLITALVELNNLATSHQYNSNSIVYIIEALLQSDDPLADVAVYSELLAIIGGDWPIEIVMDYAITHNKFNVKQDNKSNSVAFFSQSSDNMQIYQLPSCLEPVHLMKSCFTLAKQKVAAYAGFKEILTFIEANDETQEAVLHSKKPLEAFYLIMHMNRIISQKESFYYTVLNANETYSNKPHRKTAHTKASFFKSDRVIFRKDAVKKCTDAICAVCRELFSDPNWVNAGFTDGYQKGSILSLFDKIRELVDNESEDEIKAALQADFPAVEKLLSKQPSIRLH